MKKVIAYQIICLLIAFIILILHHLIQMPDWYTNNLLIVKCSLIGTLAGILYCLRAIYKNVCVLKQWGKEWEVWYYLRPLASALSGFISYIFLKAGLLVLDAEPRTDAFIFGYLAIAFIAGYNVDNFLKKVESVACEIWGIEKSRSSQNIEEKKQ